MFDVVLLPEAAKYYKKAQRPLAKKLARCFSRLETDPRGHPNVRPLTGPLAGFYRYRAGDYRIIYKIVVALRKTIAIMQKIDTAIPEWPVP